MCSTVEAQKYVFCYLLRFSHVLELCCCRGFSPAVSDKFLSATTTQASRES